MLKIKDKYLIVLFRELLSVSIKRKKKEVTILTQLLFDI
jgi:hypothetical protein